MTDPRLPPDQAVRDAALDPARSFIVQAPAGSGKTDLLTKRYLRLLATVERPEQVLAITFTRKAAAEMRNRILEALERVDPLPSESGLAPHEQQLRELATAVRQRDAELGWQISMQPGQLRIQTIDSLNAELTRQLPLLAKFGAQPQLIERPAELYDRAAQRTLALLEGNGAQSQAVEALLQHLDNNWSRAHALVVAMLQRRDQWLPRLGFSADGSRPDRAALEAAFEREVTHQLQRVRDAVPTDLADEIAALAAYAAERLQEDGRESPILACAGLQRWAPSTAPAHLPVWQGLAELLLTSDGNNWRKKPNKNQGFPPHGKQQKARVEKLLVELREHTYLRRRLQAARDLPHPHFEDTQWALLEALLGLLPVAVAQLQVVFGEYGQVDFTEMALRAQQALGTPDTPTDLALRLDLRIQHILVDEFQDTSLSQYRLLELLTAGWTPTDGRSLFVVGDPMQSIYRFREAEVGLFLTAREHGLGGITLESLTLSANFRSRPAVIDWVNTTFQQVLPSEEDIASGAVPYAPAAAQRGSAERSGVYVHPLLERDDGAEARMMLDALLAATQHNTAARIAILVRSRSHLAHILPLLRGQELRYRAVEIERLGFQPVVQDLLALTRALTHRGDRTAWLAVLRAPWCGLTLADLHAIAVADDEACVPDMLSADPLPDTVSAAARSRIARVWPVLSEALVHRQQRSLRNSVEATWLSLNGPAALQTAAALDDAETFFDLLERLEEGSDLTDPAALENRLSELFAPPDPEADDGLQVLTVHKAKGLEFDVVLVPGLGRAPGRDDQRLLLWLERPRGGHETDLLLAPLGPTGSDADPIYQLVRDLEKERARLEQGRLLYVAFTRARESLHLFGHVTVREKSDGEATPLRPNAGSPLQALWPAVEPIYSAALSQCRRPPVDADIPVRESGPWRLPDAWRPPVLPAGVQGVLLETTLSEAAESLEFSWAGETARLVGTLVHRVLQQMAGTRASDWTAARLQKLTPVFDQLMAQAGVPADARHAAVARAQQILARLPEDDHARWLLFTMHADARTEYALNYWDGSALRTAVLDRTFIDAAGIRWIVDYKTGGHEGGDLGAFLRRERDRYAEQLERYASLMRAWDPQRPIRVALYYPLLKAFKDWKPALPNE